VNSKQSTYIVLFLIVVAVISLALVSYKTGYKQSKNDLGSLLMTMTMDSNSVTSGLYEELPNKVRKTVLFFSEASKTSNKEVKLFAEVKYITVGNEVINVENGEIWNYIRKSDVFKRQFKEKNDTGKSKTQKVPSSQLAEVL
jgi:hypothetical protein